MDRAVPASILDATFTDQDGRPVTLRAFADKAVFLVPFLTSCQEECPVTTAPSSPSSASSLRNT